MTRQVVRERSTTVALHFDAAAQPGSLVAPADGRPIAVALESGPSLMSPMRGEPIRQGSEQPRLVQRPQRKQALSMSIETSNGSGTF